MINNSDKMHLYIWRIYKYIFKIYSDKIILKNPFKKLSFQIDAHNAMINRTEVVEINIVIKNDIQEKNKIVNEFCKNDNEIIPKELLNFYYAVNNILIHKHDIKKHVNKYYSLNNNIVAYFPYQTDDFVIQYSYNSNTIVLYGNEWNLYRIIQDFLTVSMEVVPLHASSVYKKDTGYNFVSESGMGKTSIVIQLLKRGYKFITDDRLFVNEDKLIPMLNYICVNRNFTNGLEIENLVKNNKNDKVNIDLEEIEPKFVGYNEVDINNSKFYILSDYKKRYLDLIQMKEPFPCISHHSFWCMFYIVNGSQRDWVENKIVKSIKYWNEKIKCAQMIKVEFEKFDEYMDKLEKKFVR